MEAEHIFQRIRREAWIVTAQSGEDRGGLLATWVARASIDREHPVVLVGIGTNHFTADLIDAGGGFGLHLIGIEQLDLAWKFAVGSGRDRDKLAGLEHRFVKTQSPILAECLAWLDCRVFARLPTGDRNYYWADVLAAENVREGEPLTEPQLVASANAEQKLALRSHLDLDVQVQRPLQQAWRNNLPDALRLS